MRPLVALALFAGLTAAAPVPKEVRKKDDNESLQGTTWKTVAENGRDGDDIVTHTWVFGPDDRLSQQYGGGRVGHKGVSEWTWKMDAETTPKKMVWTHAKDPLHVLACAYELDGDSLKIAIVYQGTPWPEKVGAGKGLYLYELKREGSGK